MLGESKSITVAWWIKIIVNIHGTPIIIVEVNRMISLLRLSSIEIACNSKEFNGVPEIILSSVECDVF